MWERLKAWWKGDVAAQHLAALDDRLLADMGLTREDVHSLVMGRRIKGAPATPERERLEQAPAYDREGDVFACCALKGV